jgi:hypothetical protein
VVLGVEAGDQGIGPDDRHHRHEPRRVGDVQPTVEDELAEAGMCLLGGSDYAEIGAVTNLASRLADEATPGPDPDLPAPLAEVEDDVEVGPVGEFTLKGFQRPVPAFNVVAVRENVELRLSQADPQYANLQGLLRERRDSNPRPPA